MIGVIAGDIIGSPYERVPEPSPVGKDLLEALKVSIPAVLPESRVKVDSKKKLAEKRISQYSPITWTANKAPLKKGTSVEIGGS